MAESEESSYTESDSDSFLSGSVNYSTDTSDDVSVSDTSVPVEFEVASEVVPYHLNSWYLTANQWAPVQSRYR